MKGGAREYLYGDLTPLPPDFIFGVRFVGKADVRSRRSKPTFKPTLGRRFGRLAVYFEVSKGGGVLYSRIDTYEGARERGSIYTGT